MGKKSITFKFVPAAGNGPKNLTVEMTGSSFREAIGAADRKYSDKLQYSLNGKPVPKDAWDTTHVKNGDSIEVTEKARGS